MQNSISESFTSANFCFWELWLLNLTSKDCSGVLRDLDTDPMATAPAIAKPSAADFPRPLAAIMVTVFLKVFSAIASINFTTAFA